jgi:putative membrane protein
MKRNYFFTILILIFLVVLIWSGIKPKDQFTWMLEIFPAIIAIVVLWYTQKSFPLTRLSYVLILIHSIILFIGGHYTYAEVPFFDVLKEVFHHSRNNYDKVGHFAQGFIPAIIIREILVRKNVIQKLSWLPFICVTICLSISACYEFLEWLVAELSGESAESFLGTQGYIWDTQSDMLLATLGAISALILLKGIHNKQIANLNIHVSKGVLFKD